MNTLAKSKTYTTLVNDITELYNRAHRALVEAYWQIGKRIAERELGSGFSVTNLRNMRRFYLSNRIQQTSAELNRTSPS